MKSDQSHPEGGPKKNPSTASQGRGQRVWYAIKSDTPYHSMKGISIKKEQDKGRPGNIQEKATTIALNAL